MFENTEPLIPKFDLGQSQPRKKVINTEAGQCEPYTKVKKETVKSSGVWQPFHETSLTERKAKKSQNLVNSAISSITSIFLE